MLNELNERELATWVPASNVDAIESFLQTRRPHTSESTCALLSSGHQERSANARCAIHCHGYFSRHMHGSNKSACKYQAGIVGTTTLQACPNGGGTPQTMPNRVHDIVQVHITGHARFATTSSRTMHRTPQCDHMDAQLMEAHVATSDAAVKEACFATQSCAFTHKVGVADQWKRSVFGVEGVDRLGHGYGRG